MKNFLLALLAMDFMLTLTACQGLTNMISGPIAIQELKSQTERLTTAAPPEDIGRLAAGDNAFAFDLYRELSTAKGSLFFSPPSISSALAMTYAGARGVTAQEMAETLHFELPADRLHPAFNGLDLELAKRGEGAKGKDGKGFRLRNVNALWGQKGYTFLPTYLDLLAQNYGAGMRILDFAKPDESRQTINAWVSEQTEGKIKDLIAKGALDAMTRLVLTNAIYFNAAWAFPFDTLATKDGPFNLLDGSKVTAPMMQRTDQYRYGQGEGYQAVELPYDKNELSMLLIVPTAGNYRAFEEPLDFKRVDGIIRSLSSKNVALAMPKFKVEGSFQLADTLKEMGMRDAFIPEKADFSGMDGTRSLFIGDVIHKSFVVVDEAGTEAAAATAVIMRATAMPEGPVVLYIDRPFIFLIRDNATGAILFIGRVLSPVA